MRASSPLGPIRVKSWTLRPSAVAPQSVLVMLAAWADEAATRNAKVKMMSRPMVRIVTPLRLCCDQDRHNRRGFHPGNMTENLFTRFSSPPLHRNKIFLAPPGREAVKFAQAFDQAGRYAHAL